MHPDDGEPIVADFGRFGPYVKHGDDFRSLESERRSVRRRCSTRALALFAAPKQSGRRQARGQAGAGDDRGAPTAARRCRCSQAATVRTSPTARPTRRCRKGIDPATLSLDDARGLLEARRGAAPRPRRGGAPRAGAGARPPARAAAGKTPPRGEAVGGRRSRRARPRRRRRSAPARKRAEPCMIRIVGGGLAGCEAAWQAASRGVPVTLHEMRPVRPTAVHKTDRLAELVCSNSFRGDKLDNAVGLLKEEMRRLGSLVMRAAEASRVPAGAALAVDRERFADDVTDALAAHPLITIVREEVPRDSRRRARRDPVIVATGPLTSEALSADIAALVGARAPLLLRRDQPDRPRRVDRSRRRCSARRAGTGTLRGSADAAARDAAGEPTRRAPTHRRPGVRRRRRAGRLSELPDDARRVRRASTTRWSHAESATVHDFDKEKFFEGCLPIEVMAHRGRDTLRFGPMKPVGLVDPRTGRSAVRGGAAAAGQPGRRSLQPGRLPDADQMGRAGARAAADSRARAGRVRPLRHGAPQHLRQRSDGAGARPGRCGRGRRCSSPARCPGVEGYVESAASGLLAGLNAARAGARRAGVAAAAHDRDRRAGATTSRTPTRRTTSRRTSPSASCRRSTGRRAGRWSASWRCRSARSTICDGLDCDRTRAVACDRRSRDDESTHDRAPQGVPQVPRAQSQRRRRTRSRAYESDLSQFLAYVAGATPACKRSRSAAGGARSRRRIRGVPRPSCTRRGSRARRRRASWRRCAPSSATCGAKG